MFDSGTSLKHLAFFQELANLEQSDPNWRAVSAGLVVLRLIDTWMEDEASRLTASDAWSVRAVRCAVEEMESTDVGRSILEAVVNAVAGDTSHRFPSVAPRLMAYAQSLEYAAKWTLAVDVYETVLAHTHPIEHADVATAAHLRLGQCYRNLNDVESAAAAFEEAGRVANAVGDLMGVLRARIGDARIAIMRGNLPSADAILDLTIADACGPSLLDVRSRAMHDKAEVAHLRGQFELAIRLAYDALALATAPSERDRILSDIAVSFQELGVFSAARDAYLVLSATAQEQYQRWVAMLNLMDIAWREGREPVFEAYRRDLSAASLPPFLSVHFLRISGEGFHGLGHLEQARVQLSRALAAAAEHQLNQLTFEVQASIDRLSGEVIQRRRQEQEPISVDLEEIAGAIRRIKEEVTVSNRG